MSKFIINCETGEEMLRELSADELAQQVIDEANAQAEQSKRKQNKLHV